MQKWSRFAEIASSAFFFKKAIFKHGSECVEQKTLKYCFSLKFYALLKTEHNPVVKQRYLSYGWT